MPVVEAFLSLTYSLPPHGGSGLKYISKTQTIFILESPSTRREWIEMASL